MTKTALQQKSTLFIGKFDLNLSKKLATCYIWSIDLYGAKI
jgi:hypothetical protein